MEGGIAVQDLKLCESDYRFMCVIWDNEPLPSGRLVELCAQRLGWKKATTYTTLKKLCEKKGFTFAGVQEVVMVTPPMGIRTEPL